MERNSRAADTHLARVTTRQHGVFSARQAADAGLSRSQLAYRLRTGRIVKIDSGVYRAATTPDGWKPRLIAACLAGPAVASHRSAALLWRFPDMSDDLVEVTAVRHRRRHVPGVIWHESFHLSERDVTEIDGIPVTRPVRTFLDLGVVLSPDELEHVLNDGLRRRLFSVAAIGRRLEDLGSLRRGTATVRTVMARYERSHGTPESVLETTFLQVLRAAGLPEPVPQYEIKLRDGSVVRVDFAYPERRIAIELDGAAYHFGDIAERRDRRRDNQLGDVGWYVRRFGWDDVTRHVDYVVSVLRPSA